MNVRAGCPDVLGAWRRGVVVALAITVMQPADIRSAGSQEPSPNRAAALSRSWKELRTPAFAVMGDAPESVLASISADIEAFRTAFRTLFPAAKIESPVPMSVVVFKDDASFSRFKPRDSRGRPMANVGGYFASEAYANLIVFGSAGNDLNFRTIFHEYAHYLLHRSGRPMPTWMDEGLAEFYSTFTARYQGKTVLGRSWSPTLSTLRNRTFIPVRTLVAPPSGQMEKMWRTPGWIAQFYAESWALVHYLIIERQASMNRYLDALGGSRSADEAFREGFGVDIETVDRELREYVRRFSFSAITVDAIDQRSQTVPAVRMREAEVRQFHGRLLLTQGAFDDAETEAQAALALDPANVDAQITLAQARGGRDRRAEAIAMLEDVARTTPSHAAGQYYLGRLLAANWRHDEALIAFERALRIDDAVSAPWMGLAASALALGRDAQASASFQHALQIESNPGLYWSHATDAFAFGRDIAAASAVRVYIDHVGWGDEGAQYTAFMAALAYQRAGQLDEAEKILALAEEAIQPKTWTFNVLQFLRGRVAADQFLAAARDLGPETEAHTYIGFKEQIAGHDALALGHFRWVVDRGAKTYREYTMVKRELDRLEQIARKRQ
jgi:tetratricopeptide (TPR) repeat protein